MDDFKHEDINNPQNKKVDETTEKTHMRGGFENPINQGQTLKSKKDVSKHQKMEYVTLVEDFSKFYLATQGVRNGFVRKFLKKGSGGYDWYSDVKKGILAHILTGKIEHVYAAKKYVLETNKPDKNWPSNKQQSIKIADNYTKISLPLKLRNCLKTEIDWENKGAFNYQDIEIRVKPELIFFTEDNDGNKILGAIKLSTNKTKPNHKISSIKIVSSLLYEYLNEHFTSYGYIVDPELCICIDINSKQFCQAPTGADVPYKVMKQIAGEYKNLWNIKKE